MAVARLFQPGETLDPAQAEQTVLDFFYDHTEDLIGPAREKFIRSLSQELQVTYAAFWLECEVENGGFRQYFENQGLTYVYEAWQACHRLGSPEHARLLEEALLSDGQEVDNVGADMKKKLQAIRAPRSLDELDDQFNEIRPRLESLRQAFVAKNREGFLYPDG